MDADLAQAIGNVLGLTFKMKNATFDGIIPGLQAGKYDIGMSSFTDTKARQKVVDFTTFSSAGTSFYTKASGVSPDDRQGPRLAVRATPSPSRTGTTEQSDATAQSAKCTKAGKAAVKVSAFPDQNAANLAMHERQGADRHGRLARRRVHRQRKSTTGSSS